MGWYRVALDLVTLLVASDAILVWEVDLGACFLHDRVDVVTGPANDEGVPHVRHLQRHLDARPLLIDNNYVHSPSWLQSRREEPIETWDHILFF